jgi:hypothetical protein
MFNSSMENLSLKIIGESSYHPLQIFGGKYSTVGLLKPEASMKFQRSPERFVLEFICIKK